MHNVIVKAMLLDQMATVALLQTCIGENDHVHNCIHFKKTCLGRVVKDGDRKFCEVQKSPNVLLTSDNMAKIADVGLAYALGSHTHVSQNKMRYVSRAGACSALDLQPRS